MIEMAIRVGSACALSCRLCYNDQRKAEPGHDRPIEFLLGRLLLQKVGMGLFSSQRRSRRVDRRYSVGPGPSPGVGEWAEWEGHPRWPSKREKGVHARSLASSRVLLTSLGPRRQLVHMQNAVSHVGVRRTTAGRPHDNA